MTRASKIGRMRASLRRWERLRERREVRVKRTRPIRTTTLRSGA